MTSNDLSIVSLPVGSRLDHRDVQSSFNFPPTPVNNTSSPSNITNGPKPLRGPGDEPNEEGHEGNNSSNREASVLERDKTFSHDISSYPSDYCRSNPDNTNVTPSPARPQQREETTTGDSKVLNRPLVSALDSLLSEGGSGRSTSAGGSGRSTSGLGSDSLAPVGSSGNLNSADFSGNDSLDSDSDDPASTIGSYDSRQDIQNELKLRKFQEEVSQRCLNGSNDIIILPTGTGKTYVAIQVVKDHLDKRRSGHCKVVFLVPTATLATQQLQKIKDHISVADKCRKITGDDNMAAGQVKAVIKESEYRVLVVTPAILNNYFDSSREASIGDFTLLIFDECHHAKEGHPYNVLLEKYHRALITESGESTVVRPPLPQLIGMTASVGIGDAKTVKTATDFMLSMFARFDLRSPPVKVTENIQELLAYSNRPDERIELVNSHREDPFTRYIEDSVMAVIESSIVKKACQLYTLTEGECDRRKLEFPSNRHTQVYEAFIIAERSYFKIYLTRDGDIKAASNYIVVALHHLLEYYKTLELVNLLDCEQGLKYVRAMNRKPQLKSIKDLWDLHQVNMGTLSDLKADVDELIENNDKLAKLRDCLLSQFSSAPDSKVIIFVRLRVVAKYLAEWLCHKYPDHFRATEFTSSGPSIREGGMKPTQLLDARKGFENTKYNILVSTSVLEEGIDIQACNMVVRYMYSKDMVGKIQARGRVRHQGGKIITILDAKLLQQEKRNDFKENLMQEVLNDIQGMAGSDFSRLLLTKRLSMFPRKLMAIRPERRKENGEVHCATCGAYLGDVCDIYCFMRGHHLVLDPNIHQRVVPFPDAKVAREMDGIVPLGLLNCKNTPEGRRCNNQVGVLIRMSDTGCSFGMWSIKNVIIDSLSYKKYQKVKDRYVIKDIYLEDLIEKAPACQFNEDVLSEMRFDLF